MQDEVLREIADVLRVVTPEVLIIEQTPLGTATSNKDFGFVINLP
jgi:hypothetical protein